MTHSPIPEAALTAVDEAEQAKQAARIRTAQAVERFNADHAEWLHHLSYLLGQAAGVVSFTLAVTKMEISVLSDAAHMFHSGQQAAYSPAEHGYDSVAAVWTAVWQRTYEFEGFPTSPAASSAVVQADAYTMMVERLTNGGGSEPDPAVILQAREIAKGAFSLGWDDEIQRQFIALHERHQAVAREKQAAAA